MKKFKKPFERSAYERINATMLEYENLHKQYTDLVYIRDTLKQGKMTEDLYNFINMDGSLERLMVNLPRPSADIACEALTQEQILFVNAAIEDVKTALKTILVRIWEALAEWFQDYWDRNRKIRIELRKLQALFNTNPAAFGTSLVFDTIQGAVYTYKNWDKMCKASQELTRLIHDIPNTGIKDWVTRNKPTINDNLAEFGRYVDDNLVIHDGNPKYDRNIISMATGGWKYQFIGQYLEQAINLLSSEIDYRKDFNKMKVIFSEGDATDSRAYFFTKALVVKTKEQVLHLSRSIKILLNRAIQNKRYTIPTR